MKKLFFVLLAVAMVSNSSAQWFPQNSGTTKTLRSVYFTDVNTGYAVGDSGKILKTINGGGNWIPLNSGITDNLYSVFFTSVNTGYAVGGTVQQFGFILKTMNGGANWSLVHTSDTIIGGIECAFNSVYFTNIDTGYAVGGDWGATLNCSLKTNNGGASWEPLSMGCQNLTSVFFTTTETGFAACEGSDGGSLWGTTDGGTTWFHIFIAWNYPTQYSIYFTDANNGYCVGMGIWKTSDGGESWSQQFVNGGNYGIRHSVYFPVSDTGYIVGGNGTILKTTNGGGYVGVSDNHQTANTLNIYPNPASGKITIEVPGISQKSYLSLFNLNGQELLKQTFYESKTIIDISNLNTGLYIVKVMGERSVSIGKFIKE